MKWLVWLFVVALAIWLANPAWFLFNIAMRDVVFAGVVGALIGIGIFIGAFKLADWLYRLWAGGGMNRM